MTGELTLKQEQFCQSYIEIGNGAEAYRQSYDSENMTQGSISQAVNELLHNSKITIRVEELKAQHQKRHNVTVDTLTVVLDAAITLAKAKIHGMLIEKVQLENKPHTGDVTRMTDEELEAIIRKHAEKEKKGNKNVH